MSLSQQKHFFHLGESPWTLAFVSRKFKEIDAAGSLMVKVIASVPGYSMPPGVQPVVNQFADFLAKGVVDDYGNMRTNG